MIVTCLLCGLQEEHEGRGLGHRCYLKVRRMGMLNAFPRGRRAPVGREPHRREYWRLWKQQKRRVIAQQKGN